MCLMMNTNGRNLNTLLYLMNIVWMVMINSLIFTEYKS